MTLEEAYAAMRSPTPHPCAVRVTPVSHSAGDELETGRSQEESQN